LQAGGHRFDPGTLHSHGSTQTRMVEPRIASTCTGLAVRSRPLWTARIRQVVGRKLGRAPNAIVTLGREDARPRVCCDARPQPRSTQTVCGSPWAGTDSGVTLARRFNQRTGKPRKPAKDHRANWQALYDRAKEGGDAELVADLRRVGLEQGVHHPAHDERPHPRRVPNGAGARRLRTYAERGAGVKATPAPSLRTES
jgi:hypothetical protein